MASQALEQILDFTPTTWQTKMYGTTSAYIPEKIMFYTPTNPFEPMIVPTDNGFIIPYGPTPWLPEPGNYHDTFKIDRYNNPYGGHTTFDIPDFPKLRIDHGNGW
jgi:hypothetical protein